MDFVSLINDILFKIFFIGAGTEPFLIQFIETVLGLPKGSIVDITIHNSDLSPDNMKEKFFIVDLLATTLSGEIFHIELQTQMHPYFIERILMYHAKLYSSQLKPGDPYSKINKTITIVITNFIVDKDSSDYHNIYMIRNKSGKAISQMQEIHVLELPKLQDVMTDEKSAWLQLFKVREEAELEQIMKQFPSLKQAIVRLKVLNADEKLREDVRNRNRALSLQRTVEENAEQRGIEKGKIETARKLLSMGLSVAQVAEGTNLSIVDVEKLSN